MVSSFRHVVVNWLWCNVNSPPSCRHVACVRGGRKEGGNRGGRQRGGGGESRGDVKGRNGVRGGRH